MQIEITLKNYRCFPDSKPATISLRKGFIAFVGVNNSGKSSLLKFFYEFRHLFEFLSYPNGNLIQALMGKHQSFPPAPSISDVEEIFCDFNNRDLEIQVRFIAMDLETERSNPLNPDRIDLTIKRGSNRWMAKIYLADGLLNIENSGVAIDFQGTILRVGGTPKVELSGVFQAFKTLRETLYIGPFRNAINIGADENYFDIQVGEAFVMSWRTWKMGNLKKQNEAIIRLTEGIKNIFDFNNLEINPSEDHKTLKVFINGKSYRLPELGSGITQFILVLANAAIKQPSYILIDEPELNLHPSLQLDFLTTLGSYASEGILFATHSIGLARASADLVYSIRKNDDGESEVSGLEATPRLSEFIGELSFSGYRELGFDKILLVEGSTDVKTVQQFLRMYRKGHRIVLLHLGGDSLINGSSEIELEEIKRISENSFVLIDSERSSHEAPLLPNRAAFVELCKKTGIKCHVLERRAIENYFPDRAVKNVKGDKYCALQPYQKLGEIKPAWSKQENWRMAREMSLTDLDATDLGDFLSSL